MQPEFFQHLLTQNYAVSDDFWNASDLAKMRAIYADLQTAGQFRAGKIGHTSSSVQDLTQRTDAICWLDPNFSQTSFIFEKLEKLRLLLNQELQSGAFRVEAHFAHYPAGAKYEKHLDVHPSQRQAAGGRILSVVSYLHSQWKEGMGGELVLYPEEALPARIAPLPGRTVFFFSELLEHEVLPSGFDRRSLACWFHRR